MYDTHFVNQILAQDIRFYVYAYLNYGKNTRTTLKKNLKCEQHCFIFTTLTTVLFFSFRFVYVHVLYINIVYKAYRLKHKNI